MIYKLLNLFITYEYTFNLLKIAYKLRLFLEEVLQI